MQAESCTGRVLIRFREGFEETRYSASVKAYAGIRDACDEAVCKGYGEGDGTGWAELDGVGKTIYEDAKRSAAVLKSYEVLTDGILAC
jgi:hypothetical protein